MEIRCGARWDPGRKGERDHRRRALFAYAGAASGMALSLDSNFKMISQ